MTFLIWSLAYLIPTRAWIKVVVVEFQELHTERTLWCLVTAEVEYRHRYTETGNMEIIRICKIIMRIKKRHF